MGEFQPLSAEILSAALAPVERGVFGLSLVHQSQVASTNDFLRELAVQGAPEGAVVIADEQTAGRGRLGRVWVSPPNANLMFTTLFRPSLPPDLALRLVMVAGLSIAEACEEIAGVKVDVKWPNDLQIDGKKFVGILPESSLTGDRLDYVLIGAGVNVNQRFDQADPLFETATSLRMACGDMIDRAPLFALIMQNCHRWHAHLSDRDLLDAWRERCVTLGQRVRALSPQGMISGLAHDIGGNGALFLKDDSGNIHFVHASEATILRD